MCCIFQGETVTSLYEEGAIEQHCATLSNQIETWCSIQVLYMPTIIQLHQTNPTHTDALLVHQDDKKLESTKLWLPSALQVGLHEMGCISDLLDKFTIG